ncbi:U3 small nucleolar ribonucleoprotein complex, subunit Mpp10 [Pholiota molesta]|nr:U3 small nucleolar ribonucleoprotein complex, subunit Mpp10 [Pholiota molesta]
MDSNVTALGAQEPAIPSEFQQLSTLLEESPQTLATGNQEIQSVALNAAKYIFNISVQSESTSQPHIQELLSSLTPTQAPQTRSKAKAVTEKPIINDAPKNLFEFTPLKSLFVDGMDDEQIWAQLDLRTKTICRMLDFVLEGESEGQDGSEEESSEEDQDDVNDDEKLRKAFEALENGEDVDMEEFMAEHGLDNEEMDDSGDSQDYEEEEGSDENGDQEEGEEEISPLRDIELEAQSSSFIPPFSHRKKKGKNAATSELDDGFFDLAEFNAETERAEARSSSRGRLAGDDDSDEEDMGIDLFASVNPTVNMDDDAEGEEEELFYRDFFEPPSRSSQAAAPTKSKKPTRSSQVRFNDQVRVKKIKATGRNRSLHDDNDGEDEEEVDNDDDDSFDDEDEFSEGDPDEAEEEQWDVEGSDSGDDESEKDSEDDPKNPNSGATIQRLKQDLFAEDEEETSQDTTTYQRRMAALKEQITELESENVAPKEWVLMGEAGSRQRPQNSLLEEDLEFERIMKPVPVTTEESVRTLEETIKARILEGRFDDVVRIRPFEDKPFLPSKFFELQDTKSSQSLAQIYEKDYVASQTEEATIDERDGRLKKEHDEINALWENICGKLDALCNAHFVPKQPKATISTVSNTATATLESALPTTKATSTMLAPEEVFSASPSALRARSELTPTEKRALRTKERKTKKRQRDALEKSVDKFAKGKGVGSVKKQKQAALDSIVKHGKGVTVVGKKGAIKSREKQKN